MDGLAAAAGVIPAFLIIGLVTFLTTRAAAHGDLVRGGLIGIRTRATTRSDAAWEAGHRAAQRAATWCAVVCAVSAVTLLGLALAGGSEAMVLVVASAGGIAAMIVLVVANARANAAASAVGEESTSPR